MIVCNMHDISFPKINFLRAENRRGKPSIVLRNMHDIPSTKINLYSGQDREGKALAGGEGSVEDPHHKDGSPLPDVGGIGIRERHTCHDGRSGPDPDMAMSKYRTRGEAANAVRSLAKAVLRYVEMLKDRTAWTREEEEALQSVKEKLRQTPNEDRTRPPNRSHT